MAKDCYRRKALAAMSTSTRNRTDNTRNTDNCLKVTTPDREQDCRGYERRNSTVYLKEGGHKCGSMLRDKIQMKFGCELPVITDACSTQRLVEEGRMNVKVGYLNGQRFKVMRDTGCTTIVVRKDLVREDQFTGRLETCVLIDGTIRRNPVAIVDLDTPFLKGRMEVECMKTLLFYIIMMENVPGVKDEDPMITRQQEKNLKQGIKQLKVPGLVGNSVTEEEFRMLQKEGQSIQGFWKVAKSSNPNTEGGTNFVVKNRNQYHLSQSKTGEEIRHLVVPVKLRLEVLKLAHETIFSGHQGITRTCDRVWRRFWWKEMNGDVGRYCQSCEVCQRPVAKGRIPKYH